MDIGKIVEKIISCSHQNRVTIITDIPREIYANLSAALAKNLRDNSFTDSFNFISLCDQYGQNIELVKRKLKNRRLINIYNFLIESVNVPFEKTLGINGLLRELSQDPSDFQKQIVLWRPGCEMDASKISNLFAKHATLGYDNHPYIGWGVEYPLEKVIR